MKIIKEACVETKEEIENATNHHADQLEICSRLDLAGLTPDIDLVNFGIEKCNRILVMIRRRNDHFIDFFYKRKLIKDMKLFNNLNVTGYVFGFLTKNKTIDERAVKFFVELAKGRETIFNMAFDEIIDQKVGIDTLVALGVTRVLTKGGSGKAIDNLARLKELREYANGRIEIIVGGGVTDDNCEEIAKATGINYFHGRKLAYK